MCGAKHLGYFGPPQFYVGLKLLAAAQSGLPIDLESLTASKLPPPLLRGETSNVSKRGSADYGNMAGFGLIRMKGESRGKG